jgi:hypothetical protein
MFINGVQVGTTSTVNAGTLAKNGPINLGRGFQWLGLEWLHRRG